MRRLLVLPLLLVLPGCVSTAVSVVEAPFKVAGAAVGAVLPNQARADRKRGRALRKAEARGYRDCRREGVTGDYALQQCVRQKLTERWFS